MQIVDLAIKPYKLVEKKLNSERLAELIDGEVAQNSSEAEDMLFSFLGDFSGLDLSFLLFWLFFEDFPVFFCFFLFPEFIPLTFFDEPLADLLDLASIRSKMLAMVKY